MLSFVFLLTDEILRLQSSSAPVYKNNRNCRDSRPWPGIVKSGHLQPPFHLSSSLPVIIDSSKLCSSRSNISTQNCRWKEKTLDVTAYQRAYQAARTRILRRYGL